MHTLSYGTLVFDDVTGEVTGKNVTVVDDVTVDAYECTDSVEQLLYLMIHW